MADIKQAARWMKEGKRVGRLGDFPLMTIGLQPSADYPTYDDGSPADFSVQSLLADDWEFSS